jgi:cytosine/creatinine deaminase
VTQSLLLKSVTLTDDSVVDIRIIDGLISAISSSLTPQQGEQEWDLRGHILSPSFIEPHAHLDKAFLADRIVNETGDLLGAINGLHAVRETLTHSDIVSRATKAAVLLSQNGVTGIRTHADTMVETGLRNIEALLETKDNCAGFIDIQVAMLLEWPLSGEGSAERHALARDAISAGVDVVGGCPHLDAHPEAAVDYLLGLAIENGLPLDLHADENLRESSVDLEYLADTMLKNNIRHQVNASHCVALSTHSESDIKRIAEKVAEAGITVTALPQTNLFLQSRHQATLAPRAITPVNMLREANVVVAAGGDNLQDPFNTVGRGDPLETASLLVTAAHVPIKNSHEMVTSDAHTVVYGKISTVDVGQRANLVAVPATTVRESIAMGPPDRFVVYGGVVINEQIRNRK